MNCIQRRLISGVHSSLAVILLVACGPAADSSTAGSTPAASGAAAELPPATDTEAPGIAGVVAPGTVVKAIRDGFSGTEGPVSMPDGRFIFTETRANRIVMIDAADSVSTFLEDSNGSNALAFDSNGRLYSVQTTPGSMRIGVIHPAGSVQVLADNFEGKPFARPNDMVLATNGGIYFTDFATVTPVPEGTLEPAVYYIAPGSGQAMRVADGIARPNGIQLSMDERVLFVNDMRGEHLLAFDIAADGGLSNRRNFASYEGVVRDSGGAITSGADGLAIDGEGRVYAATSVGVQVFSPSGALLGVIPVSRPPQNLAFAGSDRKTLYVVGSGAAYRVQMLAAGYKGRSK